jgi:hypothetical protein
MESIVEYIPEGNKNNQYPEFDPLLYWNPYCETSLEGIEDISFYTNDLVSDFEIIIQGVTDEGNPFYEREVLSIKKPIHP